MFTNAEVSFKSPSTKSQVVYGILLLLILLMVASLPIVKTTIAVKSVGVTRPTTSYSYSIVQSLGIT